MPIDDRLTPIDDDLRLAIVAAIHHARVEILWKPGKDVQHLVKRIHFGIFKQEPRLASMSRSLLLSYMTPKPKYIYFALMTLHILPWLLSFRIRYG
jgi:hypothetical protein